MFPDEVMSKFKVLRSGESTFKSLGYLGRGVFGTVVKYRNCATRELVAIKILANYENRHSNTEGIIEIAILRLLDDGNDCYVIRMLTSFRDKLHTCIVFPLMHQSLETFQQKGKMKPLSLMYIRTIVTQLIRALAKLKMHRIIHSDIKLSNIVLVDQSRLPYMIKLIDFGCARALPYNRNRCDQAVDPGYCSAPEIYLHLEYTEAIDMWSLGCIIADLFLGEPLFSHKSQKHIIYMMDELCGPFPNSMIDVSTVATSFFTKVHNTKRLPLTKQYIYCPQSYEWIALPHPQLTNGPRKNTFTNLDDFYQDSIPASDESLEERSVDIMGCLDKTAFIDLLKKMLCIDVFERRTPSQLFVHTFLTCAHFTHYIHTTSYQELYKAMDVCRRSCNAPYDYLPHQMLPQYQLAF